MRFCPDHWGRLRAAIDERGMSHLVAQSGARAVRDTVDELVVGRTIANFDPLMAAHWAIVNNGMSGVGLTLMLPDQAGESRCPLCFVNAVHEAQCADPACTLDKVNGYDAWIDKAADDAAAAWRELRAAESDAG